MSFSFADVAQESRSSGSTPKPNYNKHFPRSFLLNYGEAPQDLPNDKILATLKHWNCEWLSRPNIAMSEMAATLKDNWEQISRFKGTVFTTSFVNQLETFCAPIMPALRRLDNKDWYCHDAPDKDDILDVIEAVHKDEETETLFMEAFNACGPVLMMAIHIIAFNCLLHNPDALAEQSVKNNATDALRTNPTKQNVNQYLIDSILQKRRTVQRTTDNLWDRSLYNAGTDTPPKQKQQPRRRRLDTQDDEHATPETLDSSGTPRRRLCSLPDFAKAPTASENSPRGKRVTPQRRKPPSFTPVREDEEDNEPTQLCARALPERRARTAERRRAASKLPTTFEEEHEELEQQPPKKNKRPLYGPPTAKNRLTRDPKESKSSDSDKEDDQPRRKTTSDPKPPAPKHRKRPPTVVSSDSDVDDDTLGITPRTPPESPFYRGHRNKPTPQNKSKNTVPSTTKTKTTDGNTKTNEPLRHPKRGESTIESPPKKKKTKKPRHGLEELVQEQDRLYDELKKNARKSK